MQQVMDSFAVVDFTRFRLPIITVYKNTKDYPNKFVARIFDVDEATLLVVVKDSLEEIRDIIPARFTHMPRFDGDDPVIVETWI